MESTLLHSFLKAVKLQHWLSDPQSPPIFKEIKMAFNKIYWSSNSYDNLHDDSPADQSDLDVTTPRSIPDDLKALKHISRNKIFLKTHIKVQGIFYTCLETHLGNSLIHFYPKGDLGNPPVPGQIQYIYSTDGVCYAFTLKQHISLSCNLLDPFAQYPHFPVKAYSSKYSLSLEHIDLEWNFCHYV